jgi:hypothetical protein
MIYVHCFNFQQKQRLIVRSSTSAAAAEVVEDSQVVHRIKKSLLKNK